MEYYRLRFEESDENYYFEIDDDRTVLRQVIEDEERWVVSSRPDEELHFCLYDQDFDQSMDGADGEDISQEEFEQVWTQAMKPYRKDWNSIKAHYKPGDKVTGVVEVSYPQGIILSLPNDAFGIVADDECAQFVPVEHRYPGHMLKTVVIGFDEVNGWVELSCRPG
ncbi:hypothetical protein [Paenibacillus dauci]|uniref:hypothetical protein n=1 Tax=Paenibacillus dauci TaxID=1567106 RepID=UPI0006193158|nr:hypothetical protein [Paenibacillus dauci]